MLKRNMLIFAILVLSHFAHAQTIILVNPDPFYLKGIQYLTENKIIDIPNVEYRLLFYSKSEIEKDKSLKFISENKIDYMSIQIVEGDLTAENIYKTNSCSAEFRKQIAETNGIIFLGGWDLPPAFYGDKTNLLTQIRTPNRHLFELSFLFHLIGGSQNANFENILKTNHEYPVLGICLGMQSMNVAAGGTMYQDIPSELYGAKYVEDVLALKTNQMHRNYAANLHTDSLIDNHNFHNIKVLNADLARDLKLKASENPLVCSSHHQAVKKIGLNLEVAATSIDGKVVEALVHKLYPNVLGVQFHPEFYNLHAEDAPKQKMRYEDKRLMSEHEILVENNAYEFHENFWKLFSKKVMQNID